MGVNCPTRSMSRSMSRERRGGNEPVAAPPLHLAGGRIGPAGRQKLECGACMGGMADGGVGGHKGPVKVTGFLLPVPHGASWATCRMER